MTLERKLLITIGAALVGLIIAIAAFSLGVYVGVNGWTVGPPPVAGPGRQPQRPPDQGALPPQGMNPQTQPGDTAPAGPIPPGPRPQLVGQVQNVSDETITLTTPQGVRLFQVGSQVEVSRAGSEGQEPAALDEVRHGEHLAVYGRFTEQGDQNQGPRQLVAYRLLLLPPPPQQ